MRLDLLKIRSDLKNRTKLFVAENGPFGTPFLTPKNPSKKFMWVSFLRPFPGNEAHKLFFWGPKMGCFGWVLKKFMLKKFIYVLFRSPKLLLLRQTITLHQT